MKHLLFRLAAASFCFTFAWVGLQWTVGFLAGPTLYPVDVETAQGEETARLRVEEELRSSRSEEEEDDEPGTEDDTTPPRARAGRTRARGSSANPFAPLPDDSTESRPQITVPTTASDVALARQFDARDIHLAAYTDMPGNSETAELLHCKVLVERTLSALPAQLTASLDTLTLYLNERSPRGMANSHIVELTCGGLTDREIVAVLVHELGHVADLGAFRGVSDTPSGFVDGSIVIPVDDRSAEFYALSWVDSDTRRASAARDDFISGYAMSDPFEDFAESFTAYVLHGNDFRALATESRTLQKKYDFLRTHVFAGIEYEDERSMKDNKRVWDVTIVDYDTDSFWSRGNVSDTTIAAR